MPSRNKSACKPYYDKLGHERASILPDINVVTGSDTTGLKPIIIILHATTRSRFVVELRRYGAFRAKTCRNDCKLYDEQQIINSNETTPLRSDSVLGEFTLIGRQCRHLVHNVKITRTPNKQCNDTNFDLSDMSCYAKMRLLVVLSISNCYIFVPHYY